jgi:hypothetical protein
MKITVEVSDVAEIEKIFAFFQTLPLDSVRIFEGKKKHQPKITKGDKNIDPKSLLGIWQDSPKNIEEIRATAWKRTK